MQSRLTRRSVTKSKNQLYGSLAAIVVIMFVALTFGPFLIGATGSFIDKITGKSGQADNIQTNADIQPPTFDPIPDATPSARINISGRTDYQSGEIELFVNNAPADTTQINEDQTFNFEHVKLREGTNSLRARLIINNKKSDFSSEEFITYSKGQPKLEVSFPQDKSEFHKADKQVTIKGLTDQENSISVNGFTAIVDSGGNFSYDLNLENGENKITITATAPSGQTTVKEITVNYSE